ncbi:MAG: MoaD/ThiS family protein [Thermodesulfovibrionales bacterium]
MSVIVRLCVPLQRFTQGKEVVYQPAGSLRDIILRLHEEYPGLTDVLMSGDKLKDHFVLSINDKIVDNLEEILKDGDELSIVPLVIGG